jgi:hypothetical protein
MMSVALQPAREGRNAGELAFLLASRRPRLSFQRTRMSADRTPMAIVRTALSLIGFGFTIFQFFRYLRQSVGAAETVVRPEAARLGRARPSGGVRERPAGGVVYYNCGGVFYKPHYQSANLVYVVVPAP